MTSLVNTAFDGLGGQPYKRLAKRVRTARCTGLKHFCSVALGASLTLAGHGKQGQLRGNIRRKGNK
jgi:hypothetical protein